jgi:tetratricopeptide (TPR) repeat protein
MKKDFGQAMRYLEESYQNFVALNDKEKIIGSMNNLGNLNLDLQLYEKALKNYSEAYQLSVQSGIKFSDPVNNIGNIYFRQGNYQRAIENYQHALEIERENNNRLGILNTLSNIGIAYAKAGQPNPAKKYLDEAEALCNELQAYSYMPPILKYNAEILSLQGKSKDAYETMVRYDSLREKIYGEESTRKIVQMEMALDFQEKEKEIEMLQKEDEIKSLQLRNSRLFIVLVIIGLLTIMGAVNWYFMGKRKKIFGSTQT